MSARRQGAGRSGSALEWIERAGNALPDPATLFLIGALAVLALSQVAAELGWSVEKQVAREVRAPVHDASGEVVTDPATGEPVTVPVVDPDTGAPERELVSVDVRANGLLSADGIFWALRSMVRNFVEFPPLGIVLVGMLGIGLAERTGLISALLRVFLLGMPAAALTPTVFFVGVMSSLSLDAGYVVLPPVAAALYRAVGRSPLVGIAVVFAGVSAGFSANLVITALDPLLAGFSTAAAHILDRDYTVAATANWWFMIASTVLLTFTGWAVTSFIVEPRYRHRPAEEGGEQPPSGDTPGGGDASARGPDGGSEREQTPRRHGAEAGRPPGPGPQGSTPEYDDSTPAAAAPAEPGTALTPEERRGLRAALLAGGVTLALFTAAVAIPGAPLHGEGERFDRWIEAVIALLFLGFFVPGLAYGLAAGRLRSDRDVSRVLADTMAGMGPYIVLAFFAAQFIEYFRRSNLGEMLAIAGGQVLQQAALPAPLLVLAFVGVVLLGNLFIGSASAKYAFFAPVFVPMFMQVGISPELTQAAYRVGDSVSNVITPLNPYVVIILVFMRRYVPRAGIGTLVALMLPYTIAFAAAWAVLLLVWMGLGAELGPGGPLEYAGALR